VAVEKDGEDKWTDLVKNEEVLHVMKEEGSILHTVMEGRLTSGVGTAF